MRKGGKRLQLTPLAAPPREKGGKRLQRTRPSVLPEQRGGKRLRIQQRRTHGKPRGVMASAILLAVSVAVVAGVTFGWYDLLRETQAGAVVLKSEGQNVNVDGFTLFTYEDEEAGISSDKKTITLKSYDSVFGRNENTPVYILIPVSGQAVQSGSALTFTFGCDGDPPLMDAEPNNGKIKPLLSNVMQLRGVTVDRVPASYEEAKTMFTGAETSATPARCFVTGLTVSEDHVVTGGEKLPSIALTVSANVGSDVRYVLFQLDYNADLMSGFVKNHTGDTSGRLDLSQQISFDPDTLHITVSTS